jgi:hypothetical protein
MLECADCLILDETVGFNEDNDALLCADCLYEIELTDWLEYIMEEYAPLSWW